MLSGISEGEKASLIISACFFHNGKESLACCSEFLSNSLKVQVNGIVPPSPLLLVSRRESRHIKLGKNDGEKKIRKGEGLVPLCGRKYAPIKGTNEMEAGR